MAVAVYVEPELWCLLPQFVGSMFSSFEHCHLVMEEACPGGALAFFPNMRSQKDGEDLLEDPHEVVTSWTH